MKGRARNKILSLILTAVMLFSMLPLTAMAATPEATATETGIITAFEALSEDVTAQSVETGTLMKDLNLPNTLSVTIDGVVGTVAGVTWDCTDPKAGYDGDTANTYIFTAIIPDEYIVEDGAEPPAVTVTVKSSGADETTVKKEKKVVLMTPKITA